MARQQTFPSDHFQISTGLSHPEPRSGHTLSATHARLKVVLATSNLEFQLNRESKVVFIQGSESHREVLRNQQLN